MKRLQSKIFLLAAALSSAISLATIYFTQVGDFDLQSLSTLIVILAAVTFASSLCVKRMILLPLEQIRQLSAEITGGQRTHRLHWSYGDERDATASVLNRMSDQLGREVDEARREAQQLEAVMASMAEGVLVLDLQGRILLVNPGLRELLGVWGLVRDRNVLEVVRLPEIETMPRQAREQTDSIIQDIELRTGPQRTLMAQAVRFPADGPPAGTLAVFHDVTEIRRVDQIRRDLSLIHI